MVKHPKLPIAILLLSMLLSLVSCISKIGTIPIDTEYLPWSTETPKPKFDFSALDGKDADAYATFSLALEKFKAVSEYKALMNVNSIVTVGDADVGMDKQIEMSIKNLLDADDTTANILITTEFIGRPVVENDYYEAGYVYCTASKAGEKNYKIQASLSDITGISFNIGSINLPENTIDASELIINDSGTKTVLLRFDNFALNSFFEEHNRDIVLNEDSWFYVMLETDKEGRPSLVTVDAKIISTEDGVESDNKISVTAQYIYDNVVVTAPDGYKNYELHEDTAFSQ